MNERTTSQKVLTGLMILQVLVAFSLGVLALGNFPILLGQFGIQFHPDLGPLQFMMAYNLFLSMSICLWSVIWIRNSNPSGIQAGTTVGILMFVTSIVVFFKFDRLDILLFDGIRSCLMVVFGYISYKSIKS